MRNTRLIEGTPLQTAYSRRMERRREPPALPSCARGLRARGKPASTAFNVRWFTRLNCAGHSAAGGVKLHVLTSSVRRHLSRPSSGFGTVRSYGAHTLAGYREASETPAHPKHARCRLARSNSVGMWCCSQSGHPARSRVACPSTPQPSGGRLSPHYAPASIGGQVPDMLCFPKSEDCHVERTIDCRNPERVRHDPRRKLLWKWILVAIYSLCCASTVSNVTDPPSR